MNKLRPVLEAFSGAREAVIVTGSRSVVDVALFSLFCPKAPVLNKTRNPAQTIIDLFLISY
jgi:hypothetical protein